VQHMPALFTRLFAERLGRLGRRTVVEAGDGQPVRPGTIYVAPGGLHLEVVRRNGTVLTRLHDGPPVNFCRPAVDMLFRSVAGVYGRSVLGVVLTGMGRDGRDGCQALRAAGGEIVVQDEASSIVWGMPGAVASAGLADAVLSVPGIADHIAVRAAARRPDQTAAVPS
jgi:two-component system, chemotaxis family, protein-glutamate methylesterase/glutaminase